MLSPRVRVPLRPWLARLQPTRSESTLPSPLQRELFRRVAQPVAVITAHIPELAPRAANTAPDSTGDSAAHSSRPENHGATLSSLASVSLSPPLVSFSLRLPSRLATFLSGAAGAPPPSFRVHLLSTAQEPVARAFARQAPLPAPSRPSPPPPSSPSPSAPRQDAAPSPAHPSSAFDSSLFADLEAASLGSMTCRVVRQLPLAGLDADASPKQVDPDQPRSELFLAQVDEVRLGADREKAASLMYWDQRYAGVAPL
ncbi:hypothetical protein JCM8202_001788 [Rhodotorula sphaerocarpa]